MKIVAASFVILALIIESVGAITSSLNGDMVLFGVLLFCIAMGIVALIVMFKEQN